jgi:hypothetical protein
MERGLTDILGGVQAAEDQARATARQAQAEAKAAISEMQRQALAGESPTGNKLHDGIVGIYGEQLSPTVVQNYESVARQLESVPLYDPIVVIRRWLEDAEHICFGGDERLPRQKLDTSVAMGTLKARDFRFDFESREVYVPTAMNVIFADSRVQPTPQTGDLIVDNKKLFGFHGVPCLGYELGREIDMSVPLFSPRFDEEPVLAMEVLVGYENIQEWLAAKGEYSRDRNGELVRMRDLAKALQIKTIEPATQWQREFLQRY